MGGEMKSGTKIGMTLLAVVSMAAGRVVQAAETDRVAAATNSPTHWKWALTPPMGWNSYSSFCDSVKEDEVLASASYMKEHLLSHGWNYVVIDFRWWDSEATGRPCRQRIRCEQDPTDAYGRFVPAENRFPSSAGGRGFKPIADRIHGMGLKFGLHLMRGVSRHAVAANKPIEGSKYTVAEAADTLSTCSWSTDCYGVKGNAPAGQAWYDAVLRQCAAWELDFIKVDDLSHPYHAGEIEAIRRAIDKCGRPIVLSTSPGETPVSSHDHIAANANMWRISPDFWDNWKQLSRAFDLFAAWQGVGGPGRWPDADLMMLGHIGERCDVVGKVGLQTRFTHDEQVLHMSLWALAPSPLMLGSNLQKMDSWTLGLITNDEVLAINQDKFGKPMTRVAATNGLEVWARELGDGSRAVGLFNRSEAPAPVTLLWPDAGLKGKFVVRDLWLKKDLGVFDGNYTQHVNKHGAVLLRLRPVPPGVPVVCQGESPVGVSPEPDEAVILTPPVSRRPRINGARIFGVHPGHPFLFTIAASGDRPMRFFADNLPAGLRLDAATGQISGCLARRGESVVTLRATNSLGATERQLRVVCGDQIVLTPPMGWNSWNCFAMNVSQEKVKKAAEAMVSSGLIQHGWTYINIDDYWQQKPSAMGRDPTLGGPGRDDDGRIVPNPRFPDMKGLCDFVHAQGLKIGIYSSPGPTTCGGCLGSFDHEWLDAQTYGEWGIDYLKYDKCSYLPLLEGKRTSRVELNRFDALKGAGKKRADEMLPYAIMRAALDAVPRDIIYSFSQYGIADVWEWGQSMGGNCWRTTSDLSDSWNAMSSIGFRQAGHEKYAGPGHWNDPDMLIVGRLNAYRGNRPTRLTPNEQYAHISLWCLLASPLLIGCDLTQLDDFTLGLLTNDEVLEVNQDPLGRQAGRVMQKDGMEVWAKTMEDGSKAVGLFNRNVNAGAVTVTWADLHISGEQIVRDLWRQKDLGSFGERFEASVPRHGVVLVRIRPAGRATVDPTLPPGEKP